LANRMLSFFKLIDKHLRKWSLNILNPHVQSGTCRFLTAFAVLG